MVKKFMKRRSKRVLANKRYKVEKRVREHHRKLKKAAKKRGSSNRTPKDPGIPRMLPFRDKVVAEAMEAKAKAEETRLLEKEKLRQQRKRTAAENSSNKNSLEELAKQASERSRNFEAKKAKMIPDEEKDRKIVAKERSTAAYYHDLKKVIEKSDVLLEVVDARDPIGTRCSDVEQRILCAGKRLILVMNKIDLVPRETAQKWLRVLQSQLPTVAFKASTQTQRSNLSQKRGGRFRSVAEESSKSSQCFGAESVMKILGNYCRIKDVRTSITVGVIGLPNTGKSSLVNSLKRSKVCQVGAHAGVTRSLQEINLDKHIRLIDSPGVIFAKHLSQDEAVLRNCVNPEMVDDAIPLVDAIVKRCSPRCIMLAYNLPQFETSSEFLALMAQRWGKVKKGGVPDLNRAAKMVLRDWNSGKLGYYTEPPAALEPIVADGSTLEVVSNLAKEFDLDAITDEQFAALQEMANEMTAGSTRLDSIGPVVLPKDCLENAQEEEESDEAQEEAEEGGMIVTTRVDEKKLADRHLKKAAKKSEEKNSENGEEEDKGDGEEMEDESGANRRNVNRSRNLEAKRRKKAVRKQQNKADRAKEQSGDEDTGDDVDDVYRFDDDIPMK